MAMMGFGQAYRLAATQPYGILKHASPPITCAACFLRGATPSCLHSRTDDTTPSSPSPKIVCIHTYALQRHARTANRSKDKFMQSSPRVAQSRGPKVRLRGCASGDRRDDREQRTFTTPSWRTCSRQTCVRQPPPSPTHPGGEKFPTGAKLC